VTEVGLLYDSSFMAVQAQGDVWFATHEQVAREAAAGLAN
jgi:hypothetical protein